MTIEESYEEAHPEDKRRIFDESMILEENYSSGFNIDDVLWLERVLKWANENYEPKGSDVPVFLDQYDVEEFYIKYHLYDKRPNILIDGADSLREWQKRALAFARKYSEPKGSNR